MTQPGATRLEQQPSWPGLKVAAARLRGQCMRDWFDHPETGEARAKAMSLDAAGLFLDYSKNLIDTPTMAQLFALAREAGLEAMRDAMLGGAKLNASEGRPALHVALRKLDEAPLEVDGVDVMPAVRASWKKMAAFAAALRSGTWRGATGAPITDIVHIGIGGSDFGPRLVTDALAHLPEARFRLHFVANVDGAELERALSGLQPESTLAVISSKTFTTLETMTNAASLKHWLLAGGVPEASLDRHLIATTALPENALKFGITADNVFEFRDWVGGRFSLWSPVGLTIMLQFGAAHFEELLAGAYAMDEHFARAPLESNMPVILALLGLWYRNFLDARSCCIVPYAQHLEWLPGWMQQLDMESNGKAVNARGKPVVGLATAPVIWGQPGTNGQHAFFQWLHQSAEFAPVDFIAAIAPAHSLKGAQAPQHQAALLASCLAQSQALMRGQTLAEAMRGGKPEETARHSVFHGNRPSNTLLLPRLDPYSLGALLALYEHKVVCQGLLWGLNPFDQWGVELGKTLAAPLMRALGSAAELEGEAAKQDASTAMLLRRIAGKH
ncbi:MAG: glucose-6-phosphate isomerase [Candidatus Protistobacter heckmanni]|nr:glucose-6-phosphate isomerase [Candidatus Protistobacter heckmanni]